MSGDAKKILVVDDDQAVQKMFKDILDMYGYRAIVATGGKEALAKYEEIKPHLVIMDILMPGLDGVTTTKKILKLDKKARVIVVTAVTKRGLEKDCLKAGAKDFIMKPFKVNKLLNSIQDWIEK